MCLPSLNGHCAGKFTEERSKFYAAEIMMGLKHLHDNNIGESASWGPPNSVLGSNVEWRDGEAAGDAGCRVWLWGYAQQHRSAAGVGLACDNAAPYMYPPSLWHGWLLQCTAT